MPVKPSCVKTEGREEGEADAFCSNKLVVVQGVHTEETSRNYGRAAASSYHVSIFPLLTLCTGKKGPTDGYK